MVRLRGGTLAHSLAQARHYFAATPTFGVPTASAARRKSMMGMHSQNVSYGSLSLCMNLSPTNTAQSLGYPLSVVHVIGGTKVLVTTVCLVEFRPTHTHNITRG